MNILRIMLAIIGSLFCAGCHNKKVRSDLIGSFTANTSTQRDLIDIRDDGTYVHTFHLNPQGFEIISTNKWTCEISNGAMRITFEKFIWAAEFTPPNFSKEQRETPSFWDVEVEKSFGKVKLRIDPDVHEYYIKK